MVIAAYLCMERYLTGLVALLLFGAMAAFLGYIPIVPMIVTVLILTALVLMFLLGLYVGANADLRLLAQADPIHTDADPHPSERENGDPTTAQKNSPHPPNDSTKMAA
jgi:hypothetical protein